MKLYIKILLVSLSLIFLTGCPDEDNQPDGKNLYKGYLYYSNGNNVYRIEMNSLKSEKLFSFASYPDIRENNKILILDKNAGINKLIYTDILALNQTTILAMDGALYSYNENIHNPRLSYDKKYIAYNGQAPPPEVIEMATNKPVTITPTSSAPSAASALETPAIA